MKKALLLSMATIVVAAASAQSVGIGTTTPFSGSRLHIVANNNDTSIAALVDGNNSAAGIQVVRGGVGIGPFLPGSRLFVATDTASTGLDAFAAIFGYSQSDTSAQYGGVYGSYDPSRYGVGVQGIGYSGIDYKSYFDGTFDIGVHGSSTIGVSGVGDVFGVYAEALDLTDNAPNTQYGIYATADFGTAATKYAGYFEGDVTITGNLSKGSGTFKIDDPIDPANKYLYHSFVESPDMMNIYNGNATTDAKGFATVTLPKYFDALNKDFRYQLTTIGTFAQAIIKEEVSGNTFVIQTSEPNVKVSWQVTGVRKDKYAEAHRVQAEVDKEPWNKGLYLHAQEFGLDKTKSIGHQTTLQAKSSNSVLRQAAADTRKTAGKTNTTIPALKKPAPAPVTATVEK